MEKIGIQDANSKANIRSKVSKQYLIFIGILSVLVIIFTLTRIYCRSIEAKNNILYGQLKSISNNSNAIKTMNEKKEQLESRIKSIEEISKNNAVWSKIMFDINDLIPEGIIIDSIGANDCRVTMQFSAKDIDTLIYFVRNLEESEKLKSVRLINLSPVEGENTMKSSVYFVHE